MNPHLSDRTRPLPTRPSSAPDPERLARLLVQVWFEVRGGRRPFRQLAPLVAPALRRRLVAQLPRRPPGQRPAPRVEVRRVVVTHPCDQVYEMCVLVERGGRVTAVAVRLERRHGAWRAVELTAPEAGLPPLGTTSGVPDTPPRDAFDEVLDGW